MSRLSVAELAQEVGSELFWRRQTARRLLTDRTLTDVEVASAAPALVALAQQASNPATVINAMHTLDALAELRPELLEAALQHRDSGVRRLAVQLAERRFDAHPDVLNAALLLADDMEPMVRLQLACSLGAAHDDRVLPVLAQLARQNADDPWMTTAILSALNGRGGEMLSELFSESAELQHAQHMLEPLCFAIAARRQELEFGDAVLLIASIDDRTTQLACLRGIRSSFGVAAAVPLSDKARQSVKALASSDDPEVRSLGQALVRLMSLETAAEREARLTALKARLNDITLNGDVRSVAIAELSTEDDASIAPTLLAALSSATPILHDAILHAVFARRDRIPALLDALENKTVSPTGLSALQRTLLLESKDDAVRERASELLTATSAAELEAFPRFAAALLERRDVTHGHQVFREVCGKCHQAHGLGFAVGPDLSSEFQRAEETIIKDILVPSEAISPGYMTYTVATVSGQIFTGLLASESPTSVTLKQPEGRQQVILRNDIDELRVSAVSMMPEDLVKTLKPQDVADMIAWLRQPQERVVLLDDNEALATALNKGEGTAEFITSEKFSGESSLLITPPQRYCDRIKGWEFRIREQPTIGEYRFIRFAWKAPQASGVMLEFAADGQWPPADQPLRRYFAGRNLTPWQAVGVAPRPPGDWTVMTRDLWEDFGDFTLTGIAPTAIAGPAFFDRIELIRALDATGDTPEAK